MTLCTPDTPLPVRVSTCPTSWWIDGVSTPISCVGPIDTWEEGRCPGMIIRDDDERDSHGERTIAYYWIGPITERWANGHEIQEVSPTLLWDGPVGAWLLFSHPDDEHPDDFEPSDEAAGIETLWRHGPTWWSRSQSWCSSAPWRCDGPRHRGAWGLSPATEVDRVGGVPDPSLAPQSLPAGPLRRQDPA